MANTLVLKVIITTKTFNTFLLVKPFINNYIILLYLYFIAAAMLVENRKILLFLPIKQAFQGATPHCSASQTH
jgi:hypothetical protein